MRPYQLSYRPTDERPGWRLGTRVVPRGFTVRAERCFVHEDGPNGTFSDRRLTDAETLEWINTPEEERRGRSGILGLWTWLELDVESAPDQPPRCVALRAPHGISTPEQRFPITTVVTVATAHMASEDGSFPPKKTEFDFEDDLFEAKRVRGRKRARQAITDERLEEVARVAREHSGKPTAAVQHHFRVSRGWARKLRQRAEEAGFG